MENELEQRLRQMLNAYGVAPERNPRVARRNQERFVAMLNIIFEEQLAPKPSLESHPLSTWISIFNQLRENFANSIRRRSILIGFAVLIVLVIFLFGGIGIMAYAASSSLPGDALYLLKTTIENVRANLAIDSATEARLYMEFAGRRLSEIQSLTDEGRYTDIAPAVNEFNLEIQKAMNIIEGLSQADPVQSIALSEEIAAILRSYSDILTQMLASIPGDVQPVVQSAINSAQSGASLLDVEEDDNDDEDDHAVGLTPTLTPTPDVLAPKPTDDSLTLTPGGNGNNNTGGGNNGGGNEVGSGKDDGSDDDGSGDDDGGDG